MTTRTQPPEFGTLMWCRNMVILVATFYGVLAGSVVVFSWLFLPEVPK